MTTLAARVHHARLAAAQIKVSAVWVPSIVEPATVPQVVRPNPTATLDGGVNGPMPRDAR